MLEFAGSQTDDRKTPVGQGPFYSDQTKEQFQEVPKEESKGIQNGHRLLCTSRAGKSVVCPDPGARNATTWSARDSSEKGNVGTELRK